MSLGTETLRGGRAVVPFRGTKAQIYSHDAKGLQKQYEPFLRAVEKNDETKMKDGFAVFAFPNPQIWFAQYFAQDQVQQLVWDEESELDGDRTSTAMLLRRFLKGSHYSVHCEPSKDTTTTVKPRADAVSPLTEVPIEKYTVKFSGDDGHSMEHLANLVYFDGAFRYVGKGSYPFWSMPDATRKPAQ
jgi:hypothetical protein